ncbi:rhodanese-like domain-containing protein [Pleionea sediminis]|uniref:rhodanese-like domain-containing protein n=1 Tax=Pleionea sediminis TaxID=2569479 RepID=UPI001184E08E|nr:rhodanese-like domain-containing protein [Pleionea sediminis]
MKTAQDLVKQAKSKVKEINMNELNERGLENKLVIDVREPGEYAQGHIPGAINIPRGVLEFQISGHPAVQEKFPNGLNEETIYLYCQSGGRSALAAQSLGEMGFQHCISVDGGYVSWFKAGLPTES